MIDSKGMDMPAEVELKSVGFEHETSACMTIEPVAENGIAKTLRVGQMNTQLMGTACFWPKME